jgi:CYTH domain-containing protein
MPHTEIERKYLLSSRPECPTEAEVLRIEQGYLPPPTEDVPEDEDLREGRLRRCTSADGRVEHVHTVKRGIGLVREEREQTITAERFAAHWPRTVDARLSKTRYELRIGEVLWVVDVFDELDLVLAEAELPTADTPSEPPPWLKPLIVREVTGDPAYTNSSLARRIRSR